MNKTFKQIILLTALLLAGGSAMAQNDRQYVIWKDGHYLSHAGNTIQDATSFSPDCLWYSSNNYNYYFMNGTTRMYLKAPLALGGDITCDADPGTSILNNITLDYFFYDWDHGLARGLQHFDPTCPGEYHIPPGQDCWEAVWVSYQDDTWKMSTVYGYNPTANAAHFLRVTTTVYEEAITNVTGGVGNLADFTMETVGDTYPLDGTASNYSYTYTPAYTHYYIEGYTDTDPIIDIPAQNYYYYNNTYNSDAPEPTNFLPQEPTGYEWTLDAIGQLYLTFQGGNYQIANPTLVYSTQNTETTHQLATLTLTVTYQNGATQTRTATVTVRTLCRNPEKASDPVVTYVGVTVSWVATADSYTVSWKKASEDWSAASSVTVGDVTSYTITGLAFDTEYQYKVTTECGTNTAPVYSFTTKAEPGLMVGGAIFGGGRMADVTGKTEIVVVNCDSIGAIYGGNDIAGEVKNANGSKITLGVNDGDPNGYDTYGETPNNVLLKFGSVYGGGNGYYAYNGESFVAASSDYTEEIVPVGSSVKAMTSAHTVGDVVWTNTGTSPITLKFPKIVKTAITVSNDQIKVDSIFGGAKNAFLTFDDYTNDGSLITVDGGTILAVFGGNNWGGTQKRGKHHIVVNGTTTNVVNNSIVNSATQGYGRDFGIRYLFGGGNKVYGSTTNVEIFGGQCDTIFAGGNSADVYAANLTVNCAMGAGSGNTWGKVYSNAIDTYSGGVITPKTNYGWDGYNGIYNVRTLFGGNNQATFDSKFYKKVPNITLTSGSIGTVYGGGNAGDMWGRQEGDPVTINGDAVNYGTHVEMNSPTILIDNLYGGCQVSNVHFSTWVEVKNGHVGTVYGGCNVSGDVGSTRRNPGASSGVAYQEVYGGTYVVATGGTVYKNLFAGGNGFYHCVNDDGYYYGEINYTNHNYIGLKAPTHNETHVVVQGNVLVKGNVYAGGNLASVGFDNNTAGDNPFPKFVGLASVRMSSGTVNGNVYGGGNMANVEGSNEVQVAGGTIDMSLYGGNDRMGKVAQISNRILPDSYNLASDGQTSLLNPKVYTYVGLTGNPSITNVYGGGNGDYAYFTTFAAAQAYIDGGGDKETVVSCDITNEPIQRATFVDVGVNGGTSGAHIGTVYGGGDGVTVTEFLKVFLNVQGATDYSNVGTIFGGNNKGNLALVSDIILLKGQVDYVYGGCNEGAMTAGGEPSTMVNLKTIGGYTDIGSYVRLLNTYDPDGDGPHTPVAVDAKVTGAIFGGCRKNGVTKNSLVLVEGGNYLNTPIYGGSDISGTVSGISQVVVDGGAVGTAGNIYGGGNGDYDYTSGTYSGLTPPNSNNSRVDVISGAVLTGVYGGNNAKGNIVNLAEVNITGGTIGVSGTPANIHGGGYGAATTTDGDVTVNIGATTGGETPTYSGTAVIWGDVYGGSALGEVSATGKVTNVNFYKGTINGDVYGGGLGNSTNAAGVSGDVEVNVYGGVFNGANGAAGGGNIYGCNNANGSPSGDVNVNIYATDHGSTPQTNQYPSAPSGGWTVAALAANTALPQAYAINQVFGGGNKAAYIPANEKTATVHVYNCDNTIKQVFGGGNAADVGDNSHTTNTNVIIEGGRFYQVYGGGNGYSATGNHTDPTQPNYNPGANIYGKATSIIYAGLIDEIFGGANQWGSVDVIDLNVSSSTACDDEVYGKVFGCANEAPYNKSVTTTIECGVGTIGELYGGSNQAYIGDPDHHNIGVDVTLNLYGGGPYNNVFAGSKGTASKAADIYGNVTLNLYGGNVTNAFGGSDVKGNITGNITVNVIDAGGTCGLDLTNVYGGGNVTPYTPSSDKSSVVNVIHIAHADGIQGNVFGGAKGSTATVTANPTVNIGYDATSMASYLPTGYTVPSSPRAYVKGNVFGGGDLAPVVGSTTINVFDGEVVHKVVGGGNEAGVSVNSGINVYGGNLCTTTEEDKGIYGGCNTSGTVTGNIAVNVTGGTIGTDADHTANVHGGGYGNGTSTSGDVDVTIDGASAIIWGDVYGGSAKGSVNGDSSDETNVTLISGTIHGNLYGGGLGDGTYAAAVNGAVTVTVNGGTVNNVFGCNNVNGAPQSTVEVYINETTPSTMTINGNVYGGGNVAYYEGTPQVFIQNGTITNQVFGGGNNISTANKGVGGSNVVMSGGTVLGGIFGGCNTDGDVEGDSHVTLINGTIGSTSARASIHGGGYGQSTGVLGNVTVDFGQASTSHNDGLILYGDLYGGSALGNVNDNSSDITTVNVLNGIIQGIGDDPAITGYYGNVFGGGLGDESHPAAVNGKVHVNIGTETANGLASLVRCNVYGCNNQKGSPQDNVYVDVWGTTHTTTDEVDYYDFDRTYAIYQVFGGGNQAHYHAANNGDFLKRTHVTVHNCDNTIRYVYGGGNAANADGVETIILGGRFEEIYGGGNGRVTPANITGGGIGLNVVAGNVNFLFEGSNKEGENQGGRWYKPDASSDCLGGLFVDSYFFGTNEAELYGDLTNMINCADAGDFEYRYVYAGSRWGIVYGDINLMVGGGTIENLFGGCRGYSDYSADVRRFPTFQEIYVDYTTYNHDPVPGDPQPNDTTNRKYSYELRKYMGFNPNTYNPANPTAGQPDYAGHGGNINLVVTGGTIGNIFGGCDVKGNVEGNISVTVSQIDNACPLFVGNVYGASNQWYYNPEHSDINSPMVKILKGTIGGTHPDLPVNNIYGAPATEYEGNVFGGGNQGNVTSQPRVIIGDGTTGATATPVTVKGNVYGGGNRGDITGSPQVIVVPVRHTLNYSAGSGGSVSVTNSQYQNVPDGASIGEGIDVSIIATPADYAHTFTAWAVSSGDAIIAEPTASSTTLTMGTENSTITANFAAASSYTLSWSAPTFGTFTVTGFNGPVSSGVSVAPGVTFTLAATPDMTHKFKQWTVTGGSSVASSQSATTTFTMGSAAATITAEFETVDTHTLTFTSTTGGSCTVTGSSGNVTSGANIGEGAVLNIVATASSGYAFSNWTVEGSGSVANPTSPNTTFTMGTAEATLTAHFVPTHALFINPATNGTIKVTTGLGQEVTSGAAIGEGAKLNLKATPATGYAFSNWTVEGSGSVANPTSPNTIFTMGTADATLTAHFVPTHTLTVEEPVNGTVKITGTLGQNMASPANIGENVEVTIEATPAAGYTFGGWVIVGDGDGEIGNPSASSTTFTMKTKDTTIRAIFN